jgi:uracil-DNA glycosylase
MNTNLGAEELLLLVEQIKEQVLYFQEMGAEGLNSKFSNAALPIATDSQQSVRSISEAPVLPATLAETKVKTTRSPGAPGNLEELRPSKTKQAATAFPQNSLFEELTAAPATLPKSNESLEQIWADLAGCTRCPLHEGRTNIVHTEGNRRARLMFVGEAPGADEDAQARPFVGRAGQLLTKIIEALGLKREEVLIGNVNRCRPPGNRAPTPDEAAMCKPFLLREIACIQPEVIVVLGNTAMKNLLGVKEGITRLRGIFQDYKGTKVMPTFHPAYLLRDPSKKRETWEDLKKVKDYLDSTASRENGT